MRQRIVLVFTALILGLFSVVPPANVAAQSPRSPDPVEQDYNADQDIYFFDSTASQTDPNALCLNGTNTSGSYTPLVTANSPAEAVYKLLTDAGHGLTPAQASGIVGNLMAETAGGSFQLDPTALNSIGAYGIVQWMHERKTALMQKPNYQTLETQANFMWEELTGKYSYVGNAVKSSSTIEQSTRIVLERYEIPCLPGPGCDKEFKTRLGYAKKALAAFSGIAPANNTDPATPGCQQPTDTSTTPLPGGDPGLPSGTWIWPVTGPIYQGWGVWNSSRKGYHKGIDIGLRPGDPIKVAHDGVILGGGAQTYNSAECGRMVMIQVDGASSLYMVYQHLSPSEPMQSGTVKAGQILGHAASMSQINRGSYTCSSGPHLHFQLQVTDRSHVGYSGSLNLTRNPRDYLPK